MTALDPRSPLVVDTRELGRRPGASQRITRTAPAPADLGSEVVGVPQGSDVELRLLLEAVMEGVLVSGTVSATTAGQCVRCLDDVEAALEVPVQELYAYPRPPGSPRPEDEDLLELQGDLLDLEPAVRDALVPALPFQPVCREDCPGLPTRYGVDDDEAGDGAGALPEDVDPRWAALAQFAGSAGSEPDARGAHHQHAQTRQQQTARPDAQHDRKG